MTTTELQAPNLGQAHIYRMWQGYKEFIKIYFFRVLFYKPKDLISLIVQALTVKKHKCLHIISNHSSIQKLRNMGQKLRNMGQNPMLWKVGTFNIIK